MRGTTSIPEQLDIDVADGLRLHVVRSGRGAPLLLLHGFTGSAETWAPIRALLEEHFTVLAVDLPGHGFSGAPVDPARFALSAFADDIAHVLDTLGVGRVAVIGYSMGGRAALQFVLRYPARVAALVLESTSPGIVDPRDRAARVASDMALADMIERDGIDAFVDQWERLPLWESQATLPAGVRDSLRAQRLANQPQGLANSLRGAGAGAEPPAIERLTELRAPTLLIAGALDAKYTALARIIEASSPFARTVIVPGAGHVVHLERSFEFADLVERFLEDVTSEIGPWH